MFRKIYLMALLFSMSLLGVYADSNGVWLDASDIRVGTFGSDENTQGEFSFNILGINEELQVGGNLFVSGNSKFLNKVDMSGNRIENVPPPISNDDVATKSYVDASIASANNNIPVYIVEGSNDAYRGDFAKDRDSKNSICNDEFGEEARMLSGAYMNLFEKGSILIDNRLESYEVTYDSRWGSQKVTTESFWFEPNKFGEYRGNNCVDWRDLGDISWNNAGNLGTVINITGMKSVLGCTFSERGTNEVAKRKIACIYPRD